MDSARTIVAYFKCINQHLYTITCMPHLYAHKVYIAWWTHINICIELKRDIIIQMIPTKWFWFQFIFDNQISLIKWRKKEHNSNLKLIFVKDASLYLTNRGHDRWRRKIVMSAKHEAERSEVSLCKLAFHCVSIICQSNDVIIIRHF